MLIIGDHKQTEKDFKYTEYPKEKLNFNNIVKSTQKKLIRSYKQGINYNIWFKTLPKDRIEYLKRIGITDTKKIMVLCRINFNLLPLDVRQKLQTKY